MAPKNVLLVEGPDDQHFISSLATKFGFKTHVEKHHDKNNADMSKYTEDAIVIREMGGVDNLLEELDAQIDASDLERLGIVVDANGNCSSRWISIRDRLQNIGYSGIPTSISENGVVVAPPRGRPAVGIWIMPDNRSTGFLENFVSQLIKNDDIWNLAVDVVDRLPLDKRKFSETKKTKAQIHTWLAWQEEPGKPMGLAVTKGYLDLTRKGVSLFIEWFKATFTASVP